MRKLLSSILLLFLFTLIGCYSTPCDHSNCKYTDYLVSVDSLCERYKMKIREQMINGDTSDIVDMVNTLDGLREGQKRIRAHCLGVDSVWYKYKRIY